jgi:hypothetical protein
MSKVVFGLNVGGRDTTFVEIIYVIYRLIFCDCGR